MAVAQTFRVTRVAVTAGVKAPVTPPVICREASIGNATSADVEVHTTDDTNAEYLVIPSGYERAISVLSEPRLMPGLTAFWLKPVNSGTVVILWLV